MEAKTIGSFISALRRASGMTQKDLAERLNVSDKTVSRWERDDGAPDLSLIPVIAELFGVTCDELLRGERKTPSATTPEPMATEEPASAGQTAPPLSAKAEKQAQYLLQGTRVSFSIQSLIVTLLFLVAVVVAMIANSVFHRAYLGFLLSTVVILASHFWQAIAIILTNFATSADMLGDGMLSDTAHAEFRYWVHKVAMRNVAIGLLAFAFTLPLVLVVPDSHAGLSMSSWVGYGLLCALFASIPVGILLWFSRRRFLAHHGEALPQKLRTVVLFNHKKQLRIFSVTAGILCLTAILHLMISAGQNPRAFADTVVFDDIEAFCAFMEEDVSDEDDTRFPDAEEAPVFSYSNADGSSTTVINAFGLEEYFNKLGERITEEEALTRHIYDRDGNIVATYIARNESVSSISTGPEVTPITVYTTEAIQAAQVQLTLINAIFVVLYVLEALSAVAYYGITRKKEA